MEIDEQRLHAFVLIDDLLGKDEETTRQESRANVPHQVLPVTGVDKTAACNS